MMRDIIVFNHSTNFYYVQGLYCRDLIVFKNSTLYLPFNDSHSYIYVDKDRYLNFIHMHKNKYVR